MKRLIIALFSLALTAAALGQSEPVVWQNAWSIDFEEAQQRAADGQLGGTLRLGATQDLRTFNPFVSAESTTLTNQMMNTGATLMRRDPDTRQWIINAAESYSVSDDGLVIDVVLRDNISWSDGTPVTVQDYYFRYQAETDEDVGSNAFDGWFIEGEPIEMEVTGEREMRFTFPRPDRGAFAVVGSHLPAPNHILGEVYEEGGAEALREAWGTDIDIGETVWTGPFVPTSYTPGERATYSRNPYFGEWNVDEAGNPLPYLDQLQYSIVEDGDAELNLYIAGELDMFGPRNLDDIGVILSAVEAGDISAEVLESYSPVASSQFIVFNWNLSSDPFREELFREKRFRQAMSHLVDRAAIAELVYGGAAESMYSNVYQVLEFWVDPDVPRFDYNPDAALELLAEIGFTDTNADGILVNDEGETLSFTLATNAGNVQREQISQIFADTAREVGVDVDVQALDFNLLVDQLLSQDNDRPFEAILIGLTGGNEDWPFGVNVIPCGTNLHAWNNNPEGECLTPEEERAEELFFQGRSELDDEEALEIGYEIQRTLADLQALVFTVSPTAHTSYLTRVGGRHPDDMLNALAGTRQLPLTFIRP